MEKICEKCGKVYTTMIWGAYAEESARQCCKAEKIARPDSTETKTTEWPELGSPGFYRKFWNKSID